MDSLGFAIMLLLAGHTNAQVRGAVRSAVRPARLNPLPQHMTPNQAYSAPRFPAQIKANAGQSFQAPRLVSNAPMPINGANGFAAVAPAPLLAGPNGYAAVAPAPLQPGPNGYAAPAPIADPTMMCDAKWSVALRREVMNPDNWQCGARMAADGSWQDCVITGPTSTSVFKNISACGWKMPVFCDNTVTDLMASLLKPTSANITAPTGYTLIEGSGYYKVHTELLTWDAAKVVCENEVPGGHLALLGTPVLYPALYALLIAALPTQATGAFVGYTDVALEGTFVAVTGQPSCMLGKLIYFGGKPNNFEGNENCLALGYGGQATLNDDKCAALRPFICEVPLPSLLMPC